MELPVTRPASPLTSAKTSSKPLCPDCKSYVGRLVKYAEGGPEEGYELIDCPSCKGGVAWQERLRVGRERAQLDLSLHPLTLRNYDASLQPKAVERVSAFIQRPRGTLYLGGKPGTGKTHLLAAIGNSRISEGDDVLYAVVPRVVNMLRSVSFNDEDGRREVNRYFNRLIDCQLLLLDDLGAETQSDAAQSKVFEIIDWRQANLKATVIASNIAPSDLPPRLASRLRDRSKVVGVGMDGEDYRLRPQAERTKEPWDE